MNGSEIKGGKSLLSPFNGSKQERRALDYLSSTLIERYIGKEKGGVYLQDHNDNEPYLQVDNELKKEVKLLKYMTVYYVIGDPALRAQQRGQQKVIGELFDILYDAVHPNNGEDQDIIPNPFKQEAENLSPNPNKRTVCRICTDIITSMTEKQTVQMYERLSGVSPGSIREQIVY